MDISFVIPCYNEEGNVRLLSEEIGRVFVPESISYELVLVNDGSKDGTKAELKKLFDESEPGTVKAVHFSRNFGKEAAILCGLRHASGETVCIIDADLQQPPEVALEMYLKLVSDPDLDVVAAYQKNRKESGLLKACKRMFYKIINGMSDVEFQAHASDFRIFRKNVKDAILSLPEYFRFSKGIFAFVGFESAFIPYVVRERRSGVSKWSFTKLFRYAVEGIVGYSTEPLRFATFTGAFLSIASILFLIVLLVLSIAKVPCSAVLPVIGVIVLIGGVQMIFLGIIGEYLMRTYLQGKNRPIYIEKEVWEKK
ncbi:MAG: glycosyltransferase family 2 protein [Lachnospiraceae bacterium]|nr:glycosyltransferase family 2 protein [Lachnospiraceae bacterium]